MSERLPLGWIVAVETPTGAVLYAVREAFADEAEERLRKALKLPHLADVSAHSPIPPSTFEAFKMALSPIRGPF